MNAEKAQQLATCLCAVYPEAFLQRSIAICTGPHEEPSFGWDDGTIRAILELTSFLARLQKTSSTVTKDYDYVSSTQANTPNPADL